MGVTLALNTLSDANAERLLAYPPLIWQLIAPGDREHYESERVAFANRGRSFMGRLFKREPLPEIDDLVFAEGEVEGADLDKAWHGLHFLFTGSDAEGEFPPGFLLNGGRNVVGVDVGYGLARVLSSTEVKTVDAWLGALTPDELKKRLDPERMGELDIYPGGWRERPDQQQAYLLGCFDELQTLVRRATAASLALEIHQS